jgi:hypothetical protein
MCEPWYLISDDICGDVKIFEVVTVSGQIWPSGMGHFAALPIFHHIVTWSLLKQNVNTFGHVISLSQTWH